MINQEQVAAETSTANGVYKLADPMVSGVTGRGTFATLERFCELPYIEEDEDYTRPTRHAYTSALKLVIQARDMMREPFPAALLTTTEKGGINWLAQA